MTKVAVMPTKPGEMFIHSRGFGLMISETEAILFYLHDMTFTKAEKAAPPAGSNVVNDVPNQHGFLQTVLMFANVFGVLPDVHEVKSIYELMD